MRELAREQDALLRALARHRVELVVVGGVAAQMHGWRGATVDLDIAASLEQPNVERLNAALASVDAGPGVPGALGTVFSTVYGRLEIVRRADGIGALRGVAAPGPSAGHGRGAHGARRRS